MPPPRLLPSPGGSWGLNPFLTLWHGYPVADVLVLFPLLVVFMERQMLGQGRFWPAGALLLALAAFGGDLKMIGVLGALLALVLLMRLTINRSAHVRGGWSYSGLVMAILFAMGLLSVQLFPHIQFALEQAPSSAPMPPTPGWGALLGFFFGHGEASGQMALSPSAGHGRYLATLHAGLVPLLLTLLWLAVRRNALPAQRRRIESWWWASLLLTCAGVPAAMLLRRVGIDLFHPVPYMTFANSFIWALVGVAAADTWLALGPVESAAALRRFLRYFALAATGAVALVVFARRETLDAPPSWGAFVPASALTALFLLLVVYTLLRPRRRLAATFLIALAAVDLWLVATSALVLKSPDRLEAASPQIQAVRAVAAPVVGNLGAAQPLAALSPLDLYPSTCGVSLRRTAAFVESANAAPLLWRRAGVGAHILGAEQIAGRYSDLRVQLHLATVLPGGRALFLDPHARPAAWTTHEGREVETFDPRDLSPHRAPLLEPGPLSARLPKVADPPWTPAQIVEHTANRVAVQAILERPGVLTLAEAWHPGWRAAVNGLPAEAFPVDGMFRGVALDAGRHDVVFYFNPPEVKYGLAVTLMSALGTGIGLLYLMGVNLKQLILRR